MVQFAVVEHLPQHHSLVGDESYPAILFLQSSMLAFVESECTAMDTVNAVVATVRVDDDSNNGVCLSAYEIFRACVCRV